MRNSANDMNDRKAMAKVFAKFRYMDHQKETMRYRIDDFLAGLAAMYGLCMLNQQQEAWNILTEVKKMCCMLMRNELPGWHKRLMPCIEQAEKGVPLNEVAEAICRAVPLL